MKTIATFQSQLAAIMEALTRAAVAEICELVDDSYAVFQMEINRSRKENDELRRKLELIESIVARGGVSVNVGESSAAVVPATESPEDRKEEPGDVHVQSSDEVDRSPPGCLSSGPTAEEDASAEDVFFVKREVASDDDEYCREPFVDEDGAEQTQAHNRTLAASSSPDGNYWELKTIAADVSAQPVYVSDGEISPSRKSSVSAVGSPNHVVALRGTRPDRDSAGADPGPPGVPAHPRRPMSERDAAFPPTDAVDRQQFFRVRRYACNYCGKWFSSARGLETHVRVHTGERPYSCEQCGKRFTQSGHLKTHQSVHTGERPFACQYCDKRFAGKQNLQIHLRKNHPLAAPQEG
ncbi:zinc finger and SCAN domain-containing protein 22 [Corythoichthys intestinalis]|uniref:zinc finger and SCAN domain-containing protein 22 n=1 Tax=Corythoichthys intestinalis TaxID=161448 RepID=UPI0025A5992F|nr:zinc finger and SCAN domain-containing protein 22 [Corythoichthys intestinalis]